MILTVNLGNTHITIGGYEHDDLKFCGRLHTDPAATVDEYGLRLLNLLSLHGASPEQIEGGILGSVVPYEAIPYVPFAGAVLRPYSESHHCPLSRWKPSCAILSAGHARQSFHSCPLSSASHCGFPSLCFPPAQNPRRT